MSPRLPVVLVAGAILLVACSDASGPGEGLTLARLAGTWDMTQGELLLASDTTIRYDLMSEFGMAVRLSVTTSGDVTMIASTSGEPPDTTHGQFTLRGDTLRYATGTGSEFGFRLQLAGSTMTWVALYTEDFFDITGDGNGDEVRERYAWRRR